MNLRKCQRLLLAVPYYAYYYCSEYNKFQGSILRKENLNASWMKFFNVNPHDTGIEDVEED